MIPLPLFEAWRIVKECKLRNDLFINANGAWIFPPSFQEVPPVLWKEQHSTVSFSLEQLSTSEALRILNEHRPHPGYIIHQNGAFRILEKRGKTGKHVKEESVKEESIKGESVKEESVKEESIKGEGIKEGENEMMNMEYVYVEEDVSEMKSEDYPSKKECSIS